MKNPFGSELGLNRWARDAPARNPGGGGRGSCCPRPWCHSLGIEELPNSGWGSAGGSVGGAAGRSPPAPTNNGSHSIVWCCGHSPGDGRDAGMRAARALFSCGSRWAALVALLLVVCLQPETTESFVSGPSAVL